MYVKNHLQTREIKLDIELRTGRPYANLVSCQTLFAEAVGTHFNISPEQIIATAGTTGAIEMVRNHIFKISANKSPALLTVTPGYWRACESFCGLGFILVSIATQPNGFVIDEAQIVEKAKQRKPDLVYLSLPNNPTGAIFEPDKIIDGVPEQTAVMFDLTLPSKQLDVAVLLTSLCAKFKGRKSLFLVGSTSKSHDTAEHRIGWTVCANADDAKELRKENRNVVSTISIAEGMKLLGKTPPALGRIVRSFSLLKAGERLGLFEIVRPTRMAETAYVLIKTVGDVDRLKETLEKNRIHVMWGSEIGLTNHYIRLETLEPANIRIFIDILKSMNAIDQAGQTNAIASGTRL